MEDHYPELNQSTNWLNRYNCKNNGLMLSKSHVPSYYSTDRSSWNRFDFLPQVDGHMEEYDVKKFSLAEYPEPHEHS